MRVAGTLGERRNDEKRARWARIAGIGCGCGAVVLVLAGVVVIANWSRIASFYQSAVAGLSELQSVRAAIQSKYDTRDVVVTSKRHSAVPGRILSVELVNPPFLRDLEKSRWPEKAKEIAEYARTADPSANEFENYEIVFTERSGFGVTFGSRTGFLIPASELSSPFDPREESEQRLHPSTSPSGNPDSSSRSSRYSWPKLNLRNFSGRPDYSRGSCSDTSLR